MQLKINALFSEQLMFDVKQYMEFFAQQNDKLGLVTSMSAIRTLD